MNGRLVVGGQLDLLLDDLYIVFPEMSAAPDSKYAARGPHPVAVFVLREDRVFPRQVVRLNRRQVDEPGLFRLRRTESEERR